MKRNQNRVRQNASPAGAAPQSEKILITFKRIPIGKSIVRLQFFLEETGKKWCTIDFPTKIMAIIDLSAKRLRMNVGQFMVLAVEHELAVLEKKLS